MDDRLRRGGIRRREHLARPCSVGPAPQQRGISWDEQFTLEYVVLDTTETWEFDLTEGENLQVDLVVDTGNLAVVIEGPDGNVFYEDDDAETEAFELEITDGGRYAISVTGTDTRGSVSFKKAAAE